jgi:hypothetical protein
MRVALAMAPLNHPALFIVERGSVMIVELALLMVAQSSNAVMAVQMDEKVCRRLEVTGSVIPKRVCLTRAEWEEIDKRNRETAERFRDTNGK